MVKKEQIRKRIDDIESIITRKISEPEIQKTMIEIARALSKRDLLNPDDPNFPSDEELGNLIGQLDKLKR